MVKITVPEFDDASYIDPQARIFHHKGEIFRAFFLKTAPFYKELLYSGRMVSLIKEGKVIDADFVSDIEIDGFPLIVKQRKIPNISYYFEWSASMLKDAAMLTIDLAIDFSKDDIVLQDATPYNILFDSAKPIFIDLASFIPSIPGYIWSAYQQFCNFFLFPLYLFAYVDLRLANKLMRNSNEGICADDVVRIMSFLEKSKCPGYFSRVFLPRTISRMINTEHNQVKTRKLLFHLVEKKNNFELRKIRNNFLMGLKEDISNLRLPDKSKKGWSGYYQQTEQNILQKKLRIIDSVMRGLNPKTVLDIGCNTGEFSILASKIADKVIAFDIDNYCVDMLYKKAKSENLPILPLVMDISNPTPGLGWRGRELKNAQGRFKSDMVYVLALMHHLVFTKGLDFMRIIQSVKDFCNKWLIIEYISPDDQMARLLPRRPILDYSWYKEDNFLKVLSKNFSEVNILDKISDTRMLIIAKV